MKAISTDKIVKKLMDEAFEYEKAGLREEALVILQIAAHCESLRTDMKPIEVPKNCTLI